MGVIIEVCVDTAEGLAAAVAGGADRIELCAALALGGLTPSFGFMRQAAHCGVPVMAMIRPRAGGFVWSGDELSQMLDDIESARASGLAGVVLGANLPDGRLDVAALNRLVAGAKGMDLTLHRCFDLVPDMDAALDSAIALGFRRILTSGGAVTAPHGASRLRTLKARAGSRIVIMPGAGINAGNVNSLLPLAEVHASCSVARVENSVVADLGFGPMNRSVTDPALIKALRQAVH